MATRNRRTNVKPRPAPKPETTEPAAEVPVVDSTEMESQETSSAPPESAESVEIMQGDVDAAENVPEASAGDSEPESGPEAEDIKDSDGDGIPDNLDLDETEYRKYWLGRLAATKVVPPKGKLLFPGEPLTFTGNVVQGDMVQITEDIYRMVFPARSKRPTFTLEARAGTIVPKVRVVTKTQYRKAVGGLYDAIMEG